ncbi:MAG: L-threonylcarbamoyladenylate synthase [Chitinophagales bacterium]
MNMTINASRAIEFLKEGKVVAVPAETVYGLAADAMNPTAISKVFEIKGRPADNPLICHFHSIDQIRKYVKDIPAATEMLMQHFSPGPISCMLDLKENSPLQFATCGSAQVIARIPSHEIFLQILRGFDLPVAAPSANTSGRVSPTSAAMVERDLGNKPVGIVDGGTSGIGLESTITDARNSNEIFILRPGAIGEKEIRRILPSIKFLYEKNAINSAIPGIKYRHYAPATPVAIAHHFNDLENEKDAALLLTLEQIATLSAEQKKKFTAQKTILISLGSIRDADDIARNFYMHLAALDQSGIQKAYFLKNDWGDSSVGKALQNRIEKIVSNV